MQREDVVTAAVPGTLVEPLQVQAGYARAKSVVILAVSCVHLATASFGPVCICLYWRHVIVKMLHWCMLMVGCADCTLPHAIPHAAIDGLSALPEWLSGLSGPSAGAGVPEPSSLV